MAKGVGLGVRLGVRLGVGLGEQLGVGLGEQLGVGLLIIDKFQFCYAMKFIVPLMFYRTREEFVVGE